MLRVSPHVPSLLLLLLLLLFPRIALPLCPHHDIFCGHQLERMNNQPLAVALREIVETRKLVEGIVISSENFDYMKAKRAIATLERKIKRLGRLQAQLQEGHRLPLAKAKNIIAVDFQKAAQPRRDIRLQ